MKKGAMTAPQAILGVGVLFVVALVAVFAFGGTQQSVSNKDLAKEIATETGTKAFGGYDFEMQTTALDGSSAQDSEADVDIDLFEWNPEKNDDLVDDHYLDCSMATPARFDGTNTQIELQEKNFCDINPYKFWQDSNFYGGDSETKIDDHLILVKADLKDVDDGTESNYAYHVAAGKTYLVTVTESASTDNEDIVPFAFLFTSAKETTFDPSEMENGNINVRFIAKYYSEAIAHSKKKVSGTYEDSEDNDGDLDSGLAGIVDSSLTTATAVDIDGNIELELSADGYALLLENPLAQSNSEKPYLVVTPYGLSTGDGVEWAWEEYGTGNLTGDVGYGTTAVPSSDEIIWQAFDVCGITITDSSTSDAVKGGDEKQYEPSCFTDASERKMGVYGLFDDDAKLVIDYSIDTVTVDYDLAVNASNAQLDYASGSSPEVIADIDLVSLQASTDAIAQTLG